MTLSKQLCQNVIKISNLHKIFFQAKNLKISSLSCLHKVINSRVNLSMLYFQIIKCNHNNINHQSIITSKMLSTLTCNPLTCYECISSVPRITITVGCMVLHCAGCLNPTHPWAGIPALLIDTCKVASTLRVGNTLRFTLNVWIPNVI